MEGKVEENYFKHYENVISGGVSKAVSDTKYGYTYYDTAGGSQALYLSLDIEGLLGGSPTVVPKSPTWF